MLYFIQTFFLSIAGTICNTGIAYPCGQCLYCIRVSVVQLSAIHFAVVIKLLLTLIHHGTFAQSEEDEHIEKVHTAKR